MQRNFKEKICPKCNTTHTKSGVFCGYKCSNSRIRSVEVKNKISEPVKKYINDLPKYVLDTRNKLIAKASSKTSSNLYLYRILNDSWESLGLQARRLRVILEQDGECLICKISTWQGEDISLELDHIDGNNANNNRDNLRMLCPNCHSLTPSWRGRKNGVRKAKTDKYLNMHLHKESAEYPVVQTTNCSVNLNT